jgi:hypothetical protein
MFDFLETHPNNQETLHSSCRSVFLDYINILPEIPMDPQYQAGLGRCYTIVSISRTREQ